LTLRLNSSLWTTGLCKIKIPKIKRSMAGPKGFA